MHQLFHLLLLLSTQRAYVRTHWQAVFSCPDGSVSYSLIKGKQEL